jgi:predicted nucleic acid-binding protein
MKAYFDTNIIIDILKRREPYFEKSNAVFMLIVDGKAGGIVGASCITDIYYLIRKQYPDTHTAVTAIIDTLEIIRLANTLADDIFNAAALEFSDFEDAVVAAIAQREKADCIITRNTGDFSNSPVPAITPEEFLSKVQADF